MAAGAGIGAAMGGTLGPGMGSGMGGGMGSGMGTGMRSAQRSGGASGMHTLTYSSHTIAAPGMLKGWDGTETVGRRKTYGPRKSGPVDQVNELHTARSHHYLPTQPYFVTN